jgi:3-hydroxyisobutyrate dehydrogenase
MDTEYSAPERVGFIGLGIMGGPMARRLADAGTPLVVWNRTAGPAEELACEGALVVHDPSDVFANARIVIMMLATGQAIDTVLGREGPGFAAMVRDRTLVNMGTVSPNYSRHLMEDVERHGGHYVEAPVSGSRVPASNGELLALLAGKETAQATARPVLAPMCREVIDCGSVPNALVMKIASNILLITTATALAEAFHFADRSGVDLQFFRSVIDVSPMASALSRIKSEKLASGDFAPQAAISDVLKNVRLITAQARSNGIATPLIDQCDALYAETVELGEEALDLAAVIHAFAARSSPPRSPV